MPESSRVAALPPAKRALLDELRRRKAAAEPADSLADVAVLRAGSQSVGSQGSGDPVVLAHPIGGSLFCYVELCQSLPAGRAVAGVASGRAFGQPADLTVEELAGHYVARLAAAGMPRPAVVAGWSFGGLLAYEMARHWHQAHGVLAPVVLIDSVCWPADDPPWDQATTLRTFAEYLLGVAGVTGDQGLDAALWQLPVEAALGGLSGRLRELGVDPGLSGEELVRRYWTYANAGRAMMRYQPAGYAGPVVMIRTAQAATLADPWPTGDGVLTRRVSGDHYGVLRPPVVAEVAQAIAEAADGGSPSPHG